jgi:hypothetical protein
VARGEKKDASSPSKNDDLAGAVGQIGITGQELRCLYLLRVSGDAPVSDRVTFLSHSRWPQGRDYDAGDRIRLLKQIVDGLDETSQGRRFRRRGRCSTKPEHKVQPSLFTRLAVVEAKLSAMKEMLAELKVNQDELRRDRDEWRWRAERLLADLQRRAWWRWYNRAAAALDAATGIFCGLLADVQNKLAEMKANRDELRQGRDQCRSRAERLLIDQRKCRWRRVAGRVR